MPTGDAACTSRLGQRSAARSTHNKQAGAQHVSFPVLLFQIKALIKPGSVCKITRWNSNCVFHWQVSSSLWLALWEFPQKDYFHLESLQNRMNLIIFLIPLPTKTTKPTKQPPLFPAFPKTTTLRKRAISYLKQITSIYLLWKSSYKPAWNSASMSDVVTSQPPI